MKVYKYESIEEQLATIQQIDFKKQTADWLGRDLPTLKSAVQAMREPWAHGLDAVDSFANELPDVAVRDRKRRIKFDEYDGDELDYDRLRSGQPFWRSCVRQSTAGPGEVTIFVDYGALGHRTWREMIWRGAAAVALTRAMEDHGHRVELFAVTNGNHRFESGDDRTITTTCLKRFEDTVDVSTLINVTSGWYYRTAGFATYKAIGRDEGRTVNCGYGYSSPMTEAELANFHCDLYIRDCYSKEAALKLLKAYEQEVAKCG